MAHRDWTIELGELDVKLGIVILEQSPELAGALSRQSWLSRLTSRRR